MKKLLATAIVLPVLSLSGAAFANDANGTIKEMNSWSITLSDGTFYSVQDSKALEGLKVGDEVKVNFSFGTDNNEHQASKIEKSGAQR